jgi:hypothetical protein
VAGLKHKYTENGSADRDCHPECEVTRIGAGPPIRSKEEMFRRDFADDDITVSSIEYRDLMIRSNKNDKIQMSVRQQYLWVLGHRKSLCIMLALLHQALRRHWSNSD